MDGTVRISTGEGMADLLNRIDRAKKHQAALFLACLGSGYIQVPNDRQLHAY